MWWIVGILVVVVLYAIGHHISIREDIARIGLYEIDRMPKKSFQRFCRLLLRETGYRVHRPKRAKQWVSFVLEKDGERVALVAKQYTNQVNIRPVEKIAEGAAKNDCRRAIVLTNRDYSFEARKRARDLQVELWNRDKLADLLIRARTGGI